MYASKDSKFWDELIKEADLDGDGEVTLPLFCITSKIDYNEFITMMNKASSLKK